MFFVKGWVPLVDVYDGCHKLALKACPKPDLPPPQATDDSSDFDAPQTNAGGLYRDAWTRWHHDVAWEHISLAWHVCDSVSSVAVLNPAGKLIDASKRLLGWRRLDSATGLHVDLTVGTVGSAVWLDDDDDPPTSEDIRRRYGDFFGLPIVLKEAEVNAALAGPEPETSRPSCAPAAVARRIVEGFDVGQFNTKGQAEDLFRGDMTRGQWDAAWRLAAAERPELSAAGRRSNGR